MADLIVVDAPPVTVAVDASILATYADGVLMVLTAGRTKRGLAERAVNILRQVHANVLGVVLDNVPLKQSIYRSGEAMALWACMKESHQELKASLYLAQQDSIRQGGCTG